MSTFSERFLARNQAAAQKAVEAGAATPPKTSVQHGKTIGLKLNAIRAKREKATGVASVSDLSIEELLAEQNLPEELAREYGPVVEPSTDVNEFIDSLLAETAVPLRPEEIDPIPLASPEEVPSVSPAPDKHYANWLDDISTRIAGKGSK